MAQKYLPERYDDSLRFLCSCRDNGDGEEKHCERILWFYSAWLYDMGTAENDKQCDPRHQVRASENPGSLWVSEDPWTIKNVM